MTAKPPPISTPWVARQPDGTMPPNAPRWLPAGLTGTPYTPARLSWWERNHVGVVVFSILGVGCLIAALAGVLL